MPDTASPLLIAHLDLKGVTLTSPLLLERVKRLAGYGYNALLVEYEDCFPYKSAALAAGPEEVWTSAYHAEFLATAREAGVEIIPLQQTLGHLEYALRWDAYAAYRMPVGFPSTLHIGSAAAKAWLKGLLEEMIVAHPEARYVHLGMDEARSLSAYAKEVGCAPLGLFLDYLEELCALCEAHGKTPVIWSDMLEDHLSAESLPRICAFRDRVVLACWDYAANARPLSRVRFGGWRVSRHWQQNPEKEGAPQVGAGVAWVEDWDEPVARLAAPYKVSEAEFAPLFQAAAWKDLGFRVWGAGAASASEDGPLLPLYPKRMANLRQWRHAVSEWRLEGLIVTAWARAQTCSPPGILPELLDPLFRYGAQERRGGLEGYEPFFLRLGRCREGWRIEPELLAELEQLPADGLDAAPRELLAAVLQTKAARWRVDMATYQASRYLCGDRLPAVEWEARLADLRAAREGLAAQRATVEAVLAPRHRPAALAEWLELVFDLPLEEVDALCERITHKRERTAARFSGKGVGV